MVIYKSMNNMILYTNSTEKEELVNLVMIHVNNLSPDSQSSSRNQYEGQDSRNNNPFDQIKNTCQNLFTSFTEKIAAGKPYVHENISIV